MIVFVRERNEYLDYVIENDWLMIDLGLFVNDDLLVNFFSVAKVSARQCIDG